MKRFHTRWCSIHNDGTGVSLHFLTWFVPSGVVRRWRRWIHALLWYTSSRTCTSAEHVHRVERNHDDNGSARAHRGMSVRGRGGLFGKDLIDYLLISGRIVRFALHRRCSGSHFIMTSKTVSRINLPIHGSGLREGPGNFMFWGGKTIDQSNYHQFW